MFERHGGCAAQQECNIERAYQQSLRLECYRTINQKGMQEHICEILEGGEQAFDLRRHKYHFINS